MQTLTLAINEQQVIDLVRQLPLQSKQVIFEMLLPEIDLFERLAPQGKNRMQVFAAQRGLNWDLMNEEEQETLLDELLHESQL